jgi:hypothetical protein
MNTCNEGEEEPNFVPRDSFRTDVVLLYPERNASQRHSYYRGVSIRNRPDNVRYAISCCPFRVPLASSSVSPRRSGFSPLLVQLKHVLRVLELTLVGFDRHLNANPHARHLPIAVEAWRRSRRLMSHRAKTRFILGRS